MITSAADATCKVCEKPFYRTNTFRAVCGFKCLNRFASTAERAAKARAKDDRKATRTKLEAIKPRSKWLAEAQTAFNAFIRARDAQLPCISCGESNPPMKTGGQWDAGHFLGRGAYPELRFDEANCHKQCKQCNGYGGKFAHHERTVSQAYRIRLIDRIGLAAVEALEGPHPTAKWSIDDLRRIRDEYRIKARELGKRLAAEVGEVA